MLWEWQRRGWGGGGGVEAVFKGVKQEVIIKEE